MQQIERRLRLEEVPPAEMPEVLRVASELYAQEQVVPAGRHQELTRAAEEVGLPTEYLERAAALVHERRLERQRPRQRQPPRWVFAALAAVGVVLGTTLLGYRGNRDVPPPAAEVVTAAAPVALIGPCVEVDLSRHITHRLDETMVPPPGNDLSGLLAGLSEKGNGVRTLHGVPFRINGVVLIGPGETSSGGGVRMTVAPQVEGISIGQKARRLHFLHGTHWRAQGGTKIGAYILHYEDGTRLEIPIRYGEDLRDWWVASDRETRVAGARVAWIGSNQAAAGANSRIRLYLKRWENPYPERTIRSLDMVTGEQPSGESAPAPFLVGLTVEQGTSPRARAIPPPPAAPGP